MSTLRRSPTSSRPSLQSCPARLGGTSTRAVIVKNCVPLCGAGRVTVSTELDVNVVLRQVTGNFMDDAFLIGAMDFDLVGQPAGAKLGGRFLGQAESQLIAAFGQLAQILLEVQERFSRHGYQHQDGKFAAQVRHTAGFNIALVFQQNFGQLFHDADAVRALSG